MEVARFAGGGLAFHYFVTGRIDEIRIPTAARRERADGLWEQTCFEAFVRQAGEPGYREYNFAPSGRWAAYRFDGWRSGMAALETPGPDMRLRASGACLRLLARIRSDLADAQALRIGLSAVIEDADGGRSHWALAFPPGAADFHHETCFAAELAPAVRA